MSDQEKAERSKKKRLVTKQINRVKQLIAEDENEQVSWEIDRLKEIFKDFTAVCQLYEETLEDDDDIDQSDVYYSLVQNDYIELLKQAKAMTQNDISQTTSRNDVKEDQKLSQMQLLSIANLPKLTLEPFDGNPVNYHTFRATFDQNVNSLPCDDDAKLSRLLQYTSGAAKEAIRKCVLIGGEEGYKKAREILHTRFGNDHLVAERLINDIRNGKPINKPKDILHFADDLENSYAILEKMGKLSEMDTQSAILDILNRFQPYIQNRWKRHALDMKKERDVYPSLCHFVAFVSDLAVDLNDPVYGKVNVKQDIPVSEKTRIKRATFQISHNPKDSKRITPSYDRRQEPPCILCKENHRLWYCQQFKDMSVKNRLDLVVSNKLCLNCFMQGHTAGDCRKSSVCSVPGCGKKHTKFLHLDSKSPAATVMNNNTCANMNVYMPVVPVIVNDSYHTYALLDTASSGSFCVEKLKDKLKLDCNEVCFNLSTLSQTEEKKRSSCVNLKLSSDSGDALFMSNVFVVDSIPVETPFVDVERHPYLKNIPLVRGPVKVEVLIGQDNAEALLPLEVRKGKAGEPYATRTLFGWSLNGQATGITGKKIISHFVTMATYKTTPEYDKIWNLEESDVVSDEVGWSEEDEIVAQLWDDNCKFINNRYEIPIPWRRGKRFPNNIKVAIPRLHGLKKNLIKRGIYERYGSELQKLLQKGYAEEIPQLDIFGKEKVWYIPHHPVITEKKPDKLRVVFDCAAKYQEESLNDKAYSGPDLNNKLLHVMLRFRTGPHAIMADIEAMYNQVKVPENDRDALRFLWYDEDNTVKHFRMTSHLFGGVWCASAATYALRKTTEDQDMSPQVKDTILNSFYVDDCLKSVEDREEIEPLIAELRQALRKAGFNLTKFVSNEDESLFNLHSDDVSKDVKFTDIDRCSKALGIKWNTENDCLGFDVDVYNTQHLTRRKMLSYISSMYDPLGLVGPVLLKGKLLCQEAIKIGLAWDEQIPSGLAAEWNKWVGALKSVKDIAFPRCIKPAHYSDAVLELHHFSDASEKAYGCCSYLRCIAKDGRIHTALILSKSRVTPIKPITIPRLELQAAVLATKVDALLRRELNLQLNRSTFWVDSEIVLSYIQNSAKRFQVFVANRLSMIRRSTEIGQWRHIAGYDNPADIVSRGNIPDRMVMESWMRGPSFLRLHRSEWTFRDDAFNVANDDPEVKKDHVKSYVARMNQDSIKHPIEVLSEHFSNWYKLKRAVAWLSKVKMYLVKREIQKKLTVHDLDDAEKQIIYYAQRDLRNKIDYHSFHGEEMRRLDPQLDDENIVRVGGRTVKAGMNYKNQIIIPDGRIATLLIQYTHEIHHMGCEYTLAHLREKYWVRRKDVKRVIRKCITCRRVNGRPCRQMMGLLPETRLDAYSPPFTHVGVDCFGPFNTKRGRSVVKRYGCIFTCMCIRAVHLEVLEGLDTDSFINGLRRFIARRGQPVTITSDNGLNFVGASKELMKGLKDINHAKVESVLLQKGITWKHIPPHSSNMGGVWERHIRSVRKILTCLLRDQQLSEETLSTLLCEAESILNNRPITPTSDDVDDFQVLRPSHLLMLRECPKTPPCLSDSKDAYRRRWRQVQHLSQTFWKRWLKQYLPELQRRQKWLKKQPNVSVGDIMLIVEENMPRNLWPLCRVVEVNQGIDGLVRSVKVRTKSSVLTRPISKLVMLEGRLY